MNKTDLVSAVVTRLAENDVKVTKKSMTTYVEAMLDVIVDAMADGEDVKLTGFGNFTVVDKPERIARNPQNGSELVIPAHKAPKFKFSNTVKAVVR